MLPGQAAERRTSSLFITLAAPGSRTPPPAPEAPRRAPKQTRSCRPDRRPLPRLAPEAAGPQPPPALGAPAAGRSVSSPPSFVPSSLRDPDQGGFSPPPPPPPPGCSEPSSLQIILGEKVGCQKTGGRQMSSPSSRRGKRRLQVPSMFPAGRGQGPILSPNSGRAGEKDTPVEEKAAPADICAFCHKALCCGAPAIQAMNKQYHAWCFTCRVCHGALAGQHFFQREGRPLCTACYQNALEKCAKCQASIWSQIVRALGSGYHPECFVCVECGRAIRDETFAVDGEGQLHCLGDFYRKFASVCSACEKPITPSGGRDDYRIECLGRSFHEDCYRCQSCRVLLSPEPAEDGCYPLNGCLFCKSCHVQHKASPH